MEVNQQLYIKTKWTKEYLNILSSSDYYIQIQDIWIKHIFTALQMYINLN